MHVHVQIAYYIYVQSIAHTSQPLENVFLYSSY